MDIGIAALSEVQRPDCGEIMEGGYTYYWSGRSDGYHTQGVAVASDLTVKDAFFATLESVIDQCPKRDSLLVLGDFNA